MGLKNLKSQFDLVGGQSPVSEMKNVNPAQFDLGKQSTLQQDSLANIPTISPYQDIDGQQGPQFDLGSTSTLQQDSLGDVPTTSPYQDLDGQPGPQFDLGKQSTLQPDSLGNLPTTSPYQDLDGQPGPQFDKGVEVTQDKNSPIIDTLHEKSLNSDYSYQHGNSSEIAKATTLDLPDHSTPPIFDKGVEVTQDKNAPIIDTLHEKSLTQIYNYQHGNTPGEAPATTLDLPDHSTPPIFDKGVEVTQDTNNPIIDTIHEKSLTQPHTYTHGDTPGEALATTLDLSDHTTPPIFNRGEETQGPSGQNLINTLHEESLTQPHTYTHGDTPGEATPSEWSLDGQSGPQFAKYRNKFFNIGKEPGNPNDAYDTIAERSLGLPYSYTYGNSTEILAATQLDLPNHTKPPKFDKFHPGQEAAKNIFDTIAERSLHDDFGPIYSYQHGDTLGEAKNTSLSLKGQHGPLFAKYKNRLGNAGGEPKGGGVDTISEKLISNVPYNSNVNSLFSYGAGQPKGAGWPTITPSNPKQSTPYVAQIPGLWND